MNGRKQEDRMGSEREKKSAKKGENIATQTETMKEEEEKEK